MSVDMEAKRRAFLASHAERARDARKDGVRVLKYWRHPQAAYIDDELAACIGELDGVASKDALKHVLERLDGALALGMLAFAECLTGAWTVGDVDERFKPAGWSVDEQRYHTRIAGALEARQKHAPGFDSVGGRARGT